ncbi:aminotransferase class IV [bacterium]|jgi:branched-subunit amino acid aminotransferase/4-amino-4-deoxychorismate lyase|nr:aminotransferase class IV [bacterium]
MIIDPILINGKIGLPDSFSFPIKDAGFLYGFGVFETIRIDDRNASLWGFHLERIESSCKDLGIHLSISREQLTKWMAQYLDQLDVTEGVMNVYVTAGDRDYSQPGFVFATPNIIMTLRSRKLPVFPEIIKCQVKFVSHSETSRHKTMAYLPHLIQAMEAGNSQPIYVDNEDRLMETPMANIWLKLDGIWVTPEHPNVLPGVMRRHLLTNGTDVLGCKTATRILTQNDLSQAEAIALSNAVIGFQKAELV